MTKTALLPAGIKVTFQGNVLICYTHQSPQENYDCIQRALYQLTGLKPEILFCRAAGESQSSFERQGGKIEFYRETG